MVEGECSVELIAGRNSGDELVVEKLQALSKPEPGVYQLLTSPMFVRGIAKSDIIQKLDRPEGTFRVLRHGGNLCVRVFSKHDITPLKHTLTPELEKLGGGLDIGDVRALVYSIHVSCGFAAIEKIFNERLAGIVDAVWYYGNVYNPETGEPLNWWQPILSPD